MAFHLCFVIGGFLFLIFNCHSAPIVNVNPILVASSTSDHKQSVNAEILKSSDTDKSSSVSPIGSTTTTTTTSNLASERNDPKQKRDINEDQIDLDEFFNVDKNEDLYPYSTLNNDDDDDDDKNEKEHILFTNVKERPAKYDETLDRLDDTNLFSDLQMNPAELSTILHQRRRRRRDVKLVDPLNQRRKRSLSSYDLYSSESFDDPWANFIDEQRYVRPLRSFAPIYWYPPVLERSVRSFDQDVWPIEYVNPLVNDADEDDDDDDDDDNDDEIPITIYEEDDSDDDYEPSRYPILMKSYSFPYDNLQYQSYNTIASPFDDSDEDSIAIINENDDDEDGNDSDDEDEFPIVYEQERPAYMRYNPIENYIDV